MSNGETRVIDNHNVHGVREKKFEDGGFGEKQRALRWRWEKDE